MFILLNKYFCCTVLKNWLLFWRVAVIPLHFCMYMIWGYETLLLKLNDKTLMKWLSEQFWGCCSRVYVLIGMSRALQNVYVCVCVVKENTCLCHPFIQRYKSHTEFALLQTATSILTLHRPFLSARYLSGLFRWAWALTEQNDRGERDTAQWWPLRERGKLDTAGWCGIHFLPKIQCIPSKWTKRFLEAHNLPRWFFVFELLE